MDLTDLYKSIEEVFDGYETRQRSMLLQPGDVTNDELRDIRGRLLATKEILGALRSSLGYTTRDLT